MTVIIAAICEEGEAIVFASDKMITDDYVPVEYESPEMKIDQIGRTCVALTAGNALIPTEIISKVKEKYEHKEDYKMSEIVAEIKREYVAVRKTKVEDRYLRPLGFDLEKFYGSVVQDSLDKDILRDTHDDIVNFELKVDIIVAGTDRSGAHIFKVVDPGIDYCYDSIGFCSEGSGSTQAESLFTYVKYSTKERLNGAIFDVYEAKKRAQAAPGVGELTDIGIIDQENGIVYLTEAEETNLMTIYEKKVDIEKQRQINQMIDEFKFVGERR